MELVHHLAEKYAGQFTTQQDELLETIHKQTLATHAHAHMLSSRLQGQLLAFLSTIIQPKYILEIGTFTGYSALCLAKGLKKDGELHTIELREADANTAKGNFKISTSANRIFLHQGNALDIIPTLPHDWDIVFIDADKTGYIGYYEMAVSRLSENGVIIADNVLFHGEVLENNISGKNALAIHAFNEHVNKDPRTEQVLLTVRDGLMLIKKKKVMLLKKIIPAVSICLAALAAYCQNDSRVTEYISKYKEIAIKEMQRTGVPASITLAQGILESQNGESDLAKRSNNHFGIKCKPEWTGGKVYHDDDERGECFRSYENVEQSYMDHSDFLKNRPYYTFLFKLDPTDYEGWAKGLKKAGYATNPVYAQQLITLIQKYNLQEYTLIALQRSKEQQKEMFSYAKEEKPVVTPVVAAPGEHVADTNKPAGKTETTPVIGAVMIEGVKEEALSPVTPVVFYDAASYPGGPFSINSTKVILAKEGTSLLALANEFGISYKNLLEYNEMDESTDVLGFDQLIFLARKPKKGNKDLHIVEKNETMEIIAQKEGVQLEALLSYNRIPKGRQPVRGERIYLRTNSPVTPKLVASN